MSHAAVRSFVKLAAVVGSLAAPCSALATLVTETFTGGAGRFTTNVRNPGGGNNIAYTNTDKTTTNGGTGSGAGEMGGTFARTPSGTPSYVADPNTGTLTPLSNLNMSGHFIATNNVSFNGNVLAGYIVVNNDDPYGNGNAGLTGFSLIDGSPNLRARLYARGKAIGSAALSGVALDTPYDFNLTYDPVAQTLAGNVGPLVFPAAATGFLPTDTFTGFAILGGSAGSSIPASTVETYFDDLTYNTVVPEPGSALVVAVSAGAYLLTSKRHRRRSPIA